MTMRQTQLIFAARVLSMVFTPFYLPLVGMIALFTFSYMSLAPWQFILRILAITYIFTVLMPTLLIHLYRRSNGWTLIELGRKEKRMVPYAISIMCYTACYTLMEIGHIPHFISLILLIALAIQITCAVINVWWKISTHTAAIGGFEGALVAFSILFAFNPLWWFCVILVFAGTVGTSRMILRQHSLSQVVAGFMSGTVIGFWAII